MKISVIATKTHVCLLFGNTIHFYESYTTEEELERCLISARSSAFNLACGCPNPSCWNDDWREQNVTEEQLFNYHRNGRRMLPVTNS